MTALPPLPGILMSSRFLMAVVVGFSLAVPAYSADEPEARACHGQARRPAGRCARRPCSTSFMARKSSSPRPNLNETPLFEILQRFAKRYDLTFSINEESFKADGIADIRDTRPQLAATQVRGLTVHQFLTTVLHTTGVPTSSRARPSRSSTPVHALRV